MCSHLIFHWENSALMHWVNCGDFLGESSLSVACIVSSLLATVTGQATTAIFSCACDILLIKVFVS